MKYDTMKNHILTQNITIKLLNQLWAWNYIYLHVFLSIIHLLKVHLEHWYWQSLIKWQQWNLLPSAVSYLTVQRVFEIRFEEVSRCHMYIFKQLISFSITSNRKTKGKISNRSKRNIHQSHANVYTPSSGWSGKWWVWENCVGSKVQGNLTRWFFFSVLQLLVL